MRTRISALRNGAPGRLNFTSVLSLVVCLVWPFAPAKAGAACEPDRIDATAQVVHIHDGDTVTLADGRRVRLIGLNTPELGRDGALDQPFALEGRRALEELLGPKPSISLRFDDQRRDKYGRTLAHAYISGGRESVTAAMLRRGAGTLNVVPPNVWNWECYGAAETAARTARLGIWGLPAYQPRLVTDLPSGIAGYAIVQGRVARIGRSRDAVWINFDGPFAVRVARSDLDYFREIDFDRWSGRTLQTRGWIRPGNDDGSVMDVRHPAALDFDP